MSFSMKILPKSSTPGDPAFFGTGWKSDVPALLSAFDIFCLPTLREGFGYVFLEAQAMGVPVVATRIESTGTTDRESIGSEFAVEQDLLYNNNGASAACRCPAGADSHPQP